MLAEVSSAVLDVAANVVTRCCADDGQSVSFLGCCRVLSPFDSFELWDAWWFSVLHDGADRASGLACVNRVIIRRALPLVFLVGTLVGSTLFDD